MLILGPCNLFQHFAAALASSITPRMAMTLSLRLITTMLVPSCKAKW